MKEKPELIIIKVGGNVLDNPTVLDTFLRFYSTLNKDSILIHGGGKLASQLSTKLGIEPMMIEGRRVTDAATLRVVTMAYAGLINKDIVTALQVLGCNALGFTGADGKIVLSQKRKVENIDYGWVGDVTYVNTNQLIHFMESGLKPIIAPLTFDASVGTLLNTNADTMASAIATAFTKDYSVSLYYCFEKNGVLTDIVDENSYIPLITQAHYSELKQSGVVSAGMIPKLDNAFTAIHAGVEKVYLAPPDSVPLLIKGIKAPATLLIH